MNNVYDMKEKILNGYEIKKSEALKFYYSNLEDLCICANEIRKYFCGNSFDICTIINAKSGMCSQDCKFCAQSSFYKTDVEKYDLLSKDEIVKHAIYNYKKGILRYSIVTSGKNVSDSEIDKICDIIHSIKQNTNLEICASLGLLNKEQFEKLKNSGVTRIHNNIETSERYFKNICTTHTFGDKIKSIKYAKSVGLSVCSGGIMGLGENIEDRIDMAYSLKELDIKSIPINVLNPIPKTPFEFNETLKYDDIKRIVAIYRFILPKSSIRLAGGRNIMNDMGVECFKSGANATISGDMLTTSGVSIDFDMKMIDDLGFIKTLDN